MSILRESTPTGDDLALGPSGPTRATRKARPKPVPIRALEDIPGFPSRDENVPAYLSCKEVCKQYPNSLRDEILDCFLYYNWSARQMYDALAPNAKAWMTSNHATGQHSRSPYNVISKRLEKRRARHAKAGALDRVMNARNVRPEGHGPNFRGAARPPAQTRMGAIAHLTSHDAASLPVAAATLAPADSTAPMALVMQTHHDPAPLDLTQFDALPFDDTGAHTATSGFEETDAVHTEPFDHGLTLSRPSAPPPFPNNLAPGEFNFAKTIASGFNTCDPGFAAPAMRIPYPRVTTQEPVNEQATFLDARYAQLDHFSAIPPETRYHDNGDWLNPGRQHPTEFFEYPDPAESQLNPYFEYKFEMGTGLVDMASRLSKLI